MTKQLNIYFDGGSIVKTRASYKVMLDEEICTVYIPFSDVEKLCEECKEDEYLIAALLAYIEYVRKSTSTDRVHLAKITQKDIIQSVGNLLITFPIETVTNIFKELKWHEISKILTSKDSISEINKFV